MRGAGLLMLGAMALLLPSAGAAPLCFPDGLDAEACVVDTNADGYPDVVTAGAPLHVQQGSERVDASVFAAYRTNPSEFFFPEAVGSNAALDATLLGQALWANTILGAKEGEAIVSQALFVGDAFLLAGFTEYGADGGLGVFVWPGSYLPPGTVPPDFWFATLQATPLDADGDHHVDGLRLTLAWNSPAGSGSESWTLP